MMLRVDTFWGGSGRSSPSHSRPLQNCSGHYRPFGNLTVSIHSKTFQCLVTWWTFFLSVCCCCSLPIVHELTNKWRRFRPFRVALPLSLAKWNWMTLIQSKFHFNSILIFHSLIKTWRAQSNQIRRIFHFTQHIIRMIRAELKGAPLDKVAACYTHTLTHWHTEPPSDWIRWYIWSEYSFTGIRTAEETHTHTDTSMWHARWQSKSSH